VQNIETFDPVFSLEQWKGRVKKCSSQPWEGLQSPSSWWHIL